MTGEGSSVPGLYELADGVYDYVIEGPVMVNAGIIVGDDCVIGKNARVSDSVIWTGSAIEPGTILKDSVIGGGCVVVNGNGNSQTNPARLSSLHAPAPK